MLLLPTCRLTKALCLSVLERVWLVWIPLYLLPALDYCNTWAGKKSTTCIPEKPLSDTGLCVHELRPTSQHGSNLCTDSPLKMGKCTGPRQRIGLYQRTELYRSPLCPWLLLSAAVPSHWNYKLMVDRHKPATVKTRLHSILDKILEIISAENERSHRISVLSEMILPSIFPKISCLKLNDWLLSVEKAICRKKKLLLNITWVAQTYRSKPCKRAYKVSNKDVYYKFLQNSRCVLSHPCFWMSVQGFRATAEVGLPSFTYFPYY